MSVAAIQHRKIRAPRLRTKPVPRVNSLWRVSPSPRNSDPPSPRPFMKVSQASASRLAADYEVEYNRHVGDHAEAAAGGLNDWRDASEPISLEGPQFVWTVLPTGWRSSHAAYPSAALTNTLDLERNAITFNPTAAVILGRIYDRGHATSDDLAEWIETADEWIAFSRLQRARLLYDAGTEFTVSREGRKLVEGLLNEGDAG